jgi:alkaline phosphatase
LPKKTGNCCCTRIVPCRNALYVTADHDHYLTLLDAFPEALATLIINGDSHKITPKSNSNVNPMSTAVDSGAYQNSSKPQVEYIRDFTTWTEEDIMGVGHYWGASGSGGNGWGSHSTRPVGLWYEGDDGCIEALTGKGFQVVGRKVEGVPGKIDQMHLHGCMLRQLFGLGKEEPLKIEDLELDSRVAVQFGPRPYYLVEQMKESALKEELRKL